MSKLIDRIHAGAFETRIEAPRVGVDILSGDDALAQAVGTINAKRAEDSARLEAAFKAEALAAHGLTNHPKANGLYKLAWDLSADNGKGPKDRNNRIRAFVILGKIAEVIGE